MFCIAQIDTEGELDDAYKAWFTGLAAQGQDNIENMTIVLRKPFSFEDELHDEDNVDPTAGNRGIFEVDEVFEWEQADDELEAKVYQEYFERANEKSKKKSWF